MTKGIDISTWQSKVNFDKVKKAGYTFVIIRAGYNLTADNRFAEHIKAAHSAGLDIGVYWFYSMSSTALSQAGKVLELIAPYKNYITMPVFCDYECSVNYAHMTQSCEAFCEVVAKAGYQTGVYSNTSRLSNCPTLLKKYNIWCADWTGKCGITNAKIWQKTDKGTVDGVIGSVDVNILYDTSIIKKPLPDATTNKAIREYYKADDFVKSYNQIAKEVISGKWGNGTDRKSRLAKAGYNYILTQHLVTNILEGKS